MIYIITTLFLILINGVAKGIIHLQRRLRQDCPLSLYFFILCVERFSNLLQQAETQKLIQGLKFNNNSTITHLLFAYDSLIFTRATIKDCTNLKLIFFYKYAVASGQIFNYKKSSMFFNGNTQARHIEEIKNIFQLRVVSRHEKYLELPSMVEKKENEFFQ